MRRQKVMLLLVLCFVGLPAQQIALMQTGGLRRDNNIGTDQQSLVYTGGAYQFGGGFTPRNAPYGGFGGGSCGATKNPIIFIHGNGDEARNWDFPASTGVPSVYDEFRNAGYTDCELFGITWLSSTERATPQLNYHKPAKAAMIRDFINDVKSYTGKSQVDIIAHSMGVTLAIQGIDYGGLWGSVRKFIAIGGGLRGLSSCYWAGYANPAATVCGSQNVYNSNIFGFYPNVFPAYNPKMGDGGYRDKPSGKATIFYSIRAGYQDQILCSTTSFYEGCANSALFDSYTNVRAQLNVGRGSTAAQYDYDFTDWTIFNAGGGDADGVGHFRARNNTGVIQKNMIMTSCLGTGCCSGYGFSCN